MSHYTRKAVLEAAPGSDTKVITVHNGVNGDVFKEHAAQRLLLGARDKRAANASSSP